MATKITTVFEKIGPDKRIIEIPDGTTFLAKIGNKRELFFKNSYLRNTGISDKIQIVQKLEGSAQELSYNYFTNYHNSELIFKDYAPVDCIIKIENE